jgi:hypothetical protein
MKPQFQHKVVTSIMLWFENFFLSKAEGFSVETGKFKYYSDIALPSGYKAFGSEYKQTVYDSSINNAYIPSGVYINGSYSGFNNSTLIFDHLNARVIASGVSTTANITGKFSPKEISVYFTNDTEENVILNVQEKLNQNVANPHEFYTPYEQKLPAIYIANQSMQNKPFAFGGMNETTTKTTAVVLANEAYELDCILSIFADSYNENIPICDFDSQPLNEFGALKSGYYSYSDIKNEYKEHLFVKNVTSSKMSDKVKANLLKQLYIGFIDFELSTHRYRN